jgi:hypothetical protein
MQCKLWAKYLETYVCDHVLPMTSHLFHVQNSTHWISLLIVSTLE